MTSQNLQSALMFLFWSWYEYCTAVIKISTPITAMTTTTKTNSYNSKTKLMSAADMVAETLFQSLKCINSRRRHFEQIQKASVLGKCQIDLKFVFKNNC
jgi:hypothetical protein